jgi:hypothetical protein
MSVRQTIESAFNHVGYPGDVNIIHCSCPICRHITEHFRGTKWQIHSLEGLRKHQLAICLFTPEAFQYFLPAFLTQTLDSWSETCLIPFLITKQFIPLRADESKERQEYHAKRAAGFTAAQRAAIVAYLREYASSGTALVGNDISHAIAQLEAAGQPAAAAKRQSVTGT